MKDLDLVMSRLQSANLTLKKEKCYLFKTNVNFLGYTLCCKGVRPQTEKVESIRKMGPPTTKSQLCMFLGGMNTFHIFLPDLANITIPLNGLLTKEKTMSDWDDQCDKGFVKAKESLIKIIMLVYANPTLEYKFMQMLAVMPWGVCWLKLMRCRGRMWICLLGSLPTLSVRWSDVMLQLPKKRSQFFTALRSGILS